MNEKECKDCLFENSWICKEECKEKDWFKPKDPYEEVGLFGNLAKTYKSHLDKEIQKDPSLTKKKDEIFLKKWKNKQKKLMDF